MAQAKFVSSKRISDYADQYHANQLKLTALRKEIRELETEQDQIARHLRKQGNTNFRFNGSDQYVKQVTFVHVERFIIDNDAVRKLLKAKTPYKDTSYDSVKVDWVYETKQSRSSR